MRYAHAIQKVRALGFNEEYYICEKHQPFSAFLMLDVLLRAYWKNDLWAVQDMFRFVLYYPFMIHQEGYAYTLVLSNRIKFTTLFDDHTILQTISKGFQFIRDSVPKHKYILQRCDTGDTFDTWTLHQRAVRRRADQGYSACSLISMADVLPIEHRIDDIQINGVDAASYSEHEKKQK